MGYAPAPSSAPQRERGRIPTPPGGAIAHIEKEPEPPPPGQPADEQEPSGATGDEARALKNYEQFHGLPSGTASLDQVKDSSAGVAGWARPDVGGMPQDEPEDVAAGLRLLAGQSLALPAEEELECAFDKLRASSELLERWQGVERRMLRPARQGRGPQLGAPERRETLRFMYSFVELMGMPPQHAWFQAAVLFDTFLRYAPGDTDIGSIPDVAVALVKMLKKVDKACLDMSRSGLSGHARPLAAVLRQLGHDVPDATEDSIVAAEVLILKTLGWQISMPSIQSWTEKFCARLSVLTTGLPLGPMLELIWQRTYCNAMAIVIQAGDQPPRLLALGLLTLNAVEAGFLPLDSVRPVKHEPEAWAELASRKMPAGRAPAPSGPPEATSHVVRLLEKAMSTSREEIQDACELVLLTFERATSAASQTAMPTTTVTATATSSMTTSGLPPVRVA